MWSTKIIVVTDETTKFDEGQLKETLEKYQRMLKEALTMIRLGST